MRKPGKDIQLTSYDALLGLEDDSEKVIEVELAQLFPFKDHPFKVLQDEKMEETVESIKKYGVINPGLVRSRSEGGYEIIAGHRRRMGCKLAGKATMPVIVRKLSDDEATIVMVDSNIQRENLLYSEKAFAYKMKFEALKHQGSKGGKATTEEIGEEAGESGRQIQRYIRLTELHPKLLEMVDNRNLKFVPAVDVSYLSMKEQTMLLNVIEGIGGCPTGGQALKLKQYSISGELTRAMIELILSEVKPEVKKITLTTDKINKYFTDAYSNEEIEDIIIGLLETWKRGNI